MITSSKSPLHVNAAVDAVNITPSDDTDLAKPINGFFCGGDGDVSVVFESGTSVILKGCVTGTIYPMRLKRINATGTTATNLVGLYW